MIRQDYILRMIEEFIRVLSRIKSLKSDQLWQQAGGVIDDEFQRLVGTRAQAVLQMSDTELLAKVIQGEPTQAVHAKIRMLSTLLHQAGDVAMAQDRMEEGQACYLKGLNLLLGSLETSDTPAFPDFVPTVEAFVIALKGVALPLATQARLMQHYESVEAFARAEDMLASMLEAAPNEPKLLDLGIAFYRRLASRSDSALRAGNLPRVEVNDALTDLERRKSALVPS